MRFQIEEVIVSATKQIMRIKADTVEFDAEAYIRISQIDRFLFLLKIFDPSLIGLSLTCLTSLKEIL